jgi:glycosyltransferase involved in cell wall biosynthesis
MNPQVSVVVKSYDHAAFVGETIRSILDQSFQNFEIVVTDDGSTDGTPDVVRSFVDPRIRLEVFETNRGISAAMNATIGRARGEFIAILNSDDFALPGRLQRQVDFLGKNPDIAAVFGLPLIVDERGEPTQSYFDFTMPFSLPDLSRTTLLRHFFFHCNFLCAPTAMVRRAVYARIGSYDPRLTNLQDLDMWVRLCTDHDIHILREELTAFRVRAGNRNVSAPRHDTMLRSQFEWSQILRRYRAMNNEFLREIFASDLAAKGLDAAGPHGLWLAQLVLTSSVPAHRLFALQTMFEAATGAADHHRLRDAMGEVDVFGLLAEIARNAEITKLRDALSAKDSLIASMGGTVAAASD